MSSSVEKLPCSAPSRSTVPFPALASATTRLLNSASLAEKTAVGLPWKPYRIVLRKASDSLTVFSWVE